MAVEYKNMQVKRGTADEWAALTEPLLSGEWGFDETNGITKLGDGVTLWPDLAVVLFTGPSGQLPDDVRETLAGNLADPTTPEGAALLTNARVLIYSGGSYPARPTGALSVQYVGPVQPTTWLANDTWVDNS